MSPQPRLEERVAEHAVGLGRPVQVLHARIEHAGIDQAGRDGGFADALDHRGERLPGEAVDELGPARVDVHHAGRDADRVEACVPQERIELPADERVATRHPLQLDQAVDRLLGRGAVGMKVGRSVVALDHGDGAAGTEQPAKNRQRLDRPGQVFQDEADEDVVERPVGEGQGEDVRLPELHVGQPRKAGPALSLGERVRGDVDRHESRTRALPGQGDRLRADAAAHFEDDAPGGVSGVGVQQLDQRAGLIMQALVLPRVVAVHVLVAHVVTKPHGLSPAVPWTPCPSKTYAPSRREPVTPPPSWRR
jgi:hypothetical protein